MDRPRTYKTEAVVLRQTPLGEADRILTFYTPDLGTVRAVAKGVRRITSKLGGHLELLNNVSLSLSHGRSLDVVGEAEVVRVFRGLREDLQRLSRGLYVAELVDAFSVEQSASHATYRLLLATLGLLEKTPQPDLLLRHFELHVLEHSGYRPELHRCVECQGTIEPGDHLFDCARGGVLCPLCSATATQAVAPISLNAMKVLRLLQRESDFVRVEGLRVSSALLGDLERVLRAYIRFLAEKELKSAQFVNVVSSLGRTVPANNP